MQKARYRIAPAAGELRLPGRAVDGRSEQRRRGIDVGDSVRLPGHLDQPQRHIGVQHGRGGEING